MLDPACGTGNFLYVSLELMKRLEGEALDALEGLGENALRFAMEGETVGPRQFYGLELNPRAVAIADLVLWLGYLKWQLRTFPPDRLAEPVLHAYGTIREQDAVLAFDRQEPLRDEKGKPLSRWDGVTVKLHPITGEEVPDPDAQVELYRYENPRPAEWPEAEFVVGNPPFIGGKDMRTKLGDGYAEACWKARRKVPGGADFVMHFWDEAATRLLRKPKKGQTNPLRRFGFITTNSVTQTFSRRVIERHMGAKEPLALSYAVPDHPWLKAADKAAVRIAMTVAVRGGSEGRLATVERESGLNTDTPLVELRERTGRIAGNLKIGADITAVRPLLANDLVSSPGVKLHGAGFKVTPRQAEALGLGTTPGLERHILPYRNGQDLARHPRGVMVIDLYPLTADEVLERFPKVYQHVVERVKPERDHNNRRTYRENWWIFGEPRSDLRPVLELLGRYIATIETAKHRFFQFLDTNVRADNMLVCIGSDAANLLAVLSSRLHVHWSIKAGGWLGMGNDPRYSKSRTFEPMPFPAVGEQGDLSPMLAELGARLDSFRKERLAEHEFLTMTSLYNVLERVRELDNGSDTKLSAKEQDIHEAGLVSVLKEIHDDIDRAYLRGLRLGRPRARAGRQAGRNDALAAQDAGAGGGGGGIARPPRRAEPGAGGRGATRRRPLAAAGLPDSEARPQGEGRASGSGPCGAGSRRRQAGMAEGRTGPHPHPPRHAGPRRRPDRRGGAERGLQGQGFAPPAESGGKGPRNPRRRRCGANGRPTGRTARAAISFHGRAERRLPFDTRPRGPPPTPGAGATQGDGRACPELVEGDKGGVPGPPHPE